jgi:23S rRNA pseudouridine2604 synthase
MLPQSRVLPHQQVEIEAGARPEPVVPVTLLLYKPAGMPTDNAHRLLVAANHHEPERAGQRFLPVHAKGQRCMTPLETGASGLVAYTQEFRIERKLQEDAGILEHEVMVDVAGPVGPEVLARSSVRPRA